jgi:3-phenylpropionate/trans-cinnamate dioxygenase ferredoxin reductase subunit
MPSIVIVGGGHSAAQLCSELVSQAGNTWRDGGWKITVITQEDHLPYHRPPLSKRFLREPDGSVQLLLGVNFYEQNGIDMRLQMHVENIDRVRQQVFIRPMQPGSTSLVLGYDYLVLATGARARCLPKDWGGCATSLQGVHALRTAADAKRLAAAFKQASSLAVLGGGFIGLEVAATAASLGLRVAVVEAAPRLLARAVSPEVSEYLREVHVRSSIDVRLGAQVVGMVEHDGHFAGLKLANEALAADLLLVGIGSEPETTLASACGLDCDNGILVDTSMATRDPHIFAIGDCVAFPHPTGVGRMRLESVQNAQAQADVVARRLLQGESALPYVVAPWFWSDQGDTRLQIAGLWRLGFEAVRREGARSGSFSLLHYEGESLRAVESLNAPADHMVARRWLARGHSPPKERVSDASRSLKDL